MNLLNELVIRSIKCIDISLIGGYYLFLGICVSIILNKIFKNSEEDLKKKSTPSLIITILLHTGCIMIAAYFMRNK